MMGYKCFTGYCLTCEHWRGDKEKTLGMIEEEGTIVMDMIEGWAPSGRCNIDIEWADAAAVIKTNASFGCNYYHEENEQ